MLAVTVWKKPVPLRRVSRRFRPHRSILTFSTLSKRSRSIRTTQGSNWRRRLLRHRHVHRLPERMRSGAGRACRRSPPRRWGRRRRSGSRSRTPYLRGLRHACPARGLSGLVSPDIVLILRWRQDLILIQLTIDATTRSLPVWMMPHVTGDPAAADHDLQMHAPTSFSSPFRGTIMAPHIDQNRVLAKLMCGVLIGSTLLGGCQSLSSSAKTPIRSLSRSAAAPHPWGSGAWPGSCRRRMPPAMRSRRAGRSQIESKTIAGWSTQIPQWLFVEPHVHTHGAGRLHRASQAVGCGQPASRQGDRRHHLLSGPDRFDWWLLVLSRRDRQIRAGAPPPCPIDRPALVAFNLRPSRPTRPQRSISTFSVLSKRSRSISTT